MHAHDDTKASGLFEGLGTATQIMADSTATATAQERKHATTVSLTTWTTQMHASI